ncbi:hypothetical protein F4805DRAFT_397085 [Annulohypoxylon moriforme]|nr:hypothetical protein F4805DRAFT_397085 [Annulohypoxylon moriforme]
MESNFGFAVASSLAPLILALEYPLVDIRQISPDRGPDTILLISYGLLFPFFDDSRFTTQFPWLERSRRPQKAWICVSKTYSTFLLSCLGCLNGTSGTLIRGVVNGI